MSVASPDFPVIGAAPGTQPGRGTVVVAGRTAIAGRGHDLAAGAA